MASVFYPRSGDNSAAEINRVAKIQASELDTTQDAVAGKQPHLLTLTKRKVNTMDLLEVSNNAAWAALVAALVNPLHKKVFQIGNFDRIRYRYKVYGWQRSVLQELHDALP